MAERVVPLTHEQQDAVASAFFTHFCPAHELCASVLHQVNSQPDGSPGLRLLRDQIFRALAVRLASPIYDTLSPHPSDPSPLQVQLAAADGGDEDRTLEAVARYYLHAGRGNPSDHGFTDLNEQALDTFVVARWPGGFAEMSRGPEGGGQGECYC